MSSSSFSSDAVVVAREIIDVRVLSDMIHSMGRDVLSTSEKRMLLRARQRATAWGSSAKEKTVGTGGSGRDMTVAPPPPPAGLTLHERRKRKIDFLGGA